MDEESTEEMMFTAEELEALEPIAEEDFESPSFIGGVCINMNPKSKEIRDVIDYLAKDTNEKYY